MVALALVAQVREVRREGVGSVRDVLHGAARPMSQKSVVDLRLSALEGVAGRLTDAIQRLTTLEEAQSTMKGTFARSFERLEQMEVAITGDGTDSRPGLYAAMVGVRADLRANTFLTQLIVSLMAAEFVLGIVGGIYYALKLTGKGP
jgi:hypothetical protein